MIEQMRQSQARGGTIAAANAVCVLRAILKELIQQLNAEQLLNGFFELPPALTPGAVSVNLQVEFADLHEGSLVASLSRAALSTVAVKQVVMR